MKKMMMLLLAVALFVGLSGCASSPLGPNGLREIKKSDVNNPANRPASTLILYNSYSCSHAWVYMFLGARTDDQMFANVNGIPKIFEGEYFQKVYLGNCFNKNFPIKKIFALDTGITVTALIVVEHGAFGKILALQRYVVSTNRGMFTAQFVDPLGFRSQWANNVIAVPGTDTPAYLGPFPGTFTISPSQVLFGR